MQLNFEIFFYGGFMLEEELKNKTAIRYFKKFDCTDIIKRIDFTVKVSGKINSEYLLWAEAKQSPTDIYKMLAQLIVTIKQDAYNLLPPKFIGCFDSEKIAFVEYNAVLPVYALNDFNWSQTPSNVDEKTIATIKKTVNTDNILKFYFGKDDDEIHNFIEQNFVEGGSLLSTLIDKNNFIFVYQKWREMVMPSINADWEKLKKNYNIYDRDFFLAELNIDDNDTTDISDDKVAYPDFFISFNSTASKCYQLTRKDNFGLEVTYSFGYKNGGLEKYADFWKRYKRPPKNVYWNYIISRLDLLVPQDVRERKGAYYTPQIWVELSQKYLAGELGKNWQDEYYIWDCCAGTGNLLNGLVNKYNIFASTLDQQDVEVMKERIKNGANLLESHVFQFDFLNDELLPVGKSVKVETDFGIMEISGKLPQALYDIISDPERRKKLLIYINPPYKEATSAATVQGTGSNKSGVATSNMVYKKYKNILGKASNEVFTQFQIRIYKELSQCKIGNFAKLKTLCASNFSDFRNAFQAKLKKLFIVPAKTFDNVDGSFPIGFFIWDTSEIEKFKKIKCDVFSADGSFFGHKKYQVDDEKHESINRWIKRLDTETENIVGYMENPTPDFQNNKFLCIINNKGTRHNNYSAINAKTLIVNAVYFSVRQCIKQTWLNDRDQFLSPKVKWEKDFEFQTNCLIYTIFHSQNRISSNNGINHWIPFTEYEVDAKEKFQSHFLSDFLSGKVKAEKSNANLFSLAAVESRLIVTLQFSDTAKAVLSAGRELWKYYHTMEAANVNASLYDIKEFFQGRDKNGKMKTGSIDAYYTELLANLKSALWDLGEIIKPKVYEYGFLSE